MPQVCKILGYLIFFWSREENEPPHVHICKGKPHKDATKIWIEELPKLEHNKSEIVAHDLNRIMQWLTINRDFLQNGMNTSTDFRHTKAVVSHDREATVFFIFKPLDFITFSEAKKF